MVKAWSSGIVLSGCIALVACAAPEPATGSVAEDITLKPPGMFGGLSGLVPKGEINPLALYVDPQGHGDCSLRAPCATLNEALTAANRFDSRLPMQIYVAPGDYQDAPYVITRPNLWLHGVSGGTKLDNQGVFLTMGIRASNVRIQGFDFRCPGVNCLFGVLASSVDGSSLAGVVLEENSFADDQFDIFFADTSGRIAFNFSGTSGIAGAYAEASATPEGAHVDIEGNLFSNKEACIAVAASANTFGVGRQVARISDNQVADCDFGAGLFVNGYFSEDDGSDGGELDAVVEGNLFVNSSSQAITVSSLDCVLRPAGDCAPLAPGVVKLTVNNNEFDDSNDHAAFFDFNLVDQNIDDTGVYMEDSTFLVTDRDGELAANFTWNNTCGTANGNRLTVNGVTYVDDGFSLDATNLTVDPSTMNTGDTATVTMTIVNDEGYQVTCATGLPVVFSIGGGDADGFFGDVTDNGNGTYSVTFTGTSPGTNNMTGFIDGDAVEGGDGPSFTVIQN
jgi:hypothetical protein